MKYCKLCLQPDTRPNTVVTEEGLCPACNYYEQSKEIDWQLCLLGPKGSA